MLMNAINEMTAEIKSSRNMFCVKQPETLVLKLQDDWERWTLIKNLATEKKYPTQDYARCKSIEQAYNKVKVNEGIDAFYYTLEFIGLKNRLVQKHVDDLIERVLEV